MHSDQALRDAGRPERTREREMLGAIPYQRNEAVLHTDATLLPRRRRAWASWNYHLQDEPSGRSTVTYHMNRLQSLDSTQRDLRDSEPQRGDRPGAVIETIPYYHPVYTQRRPGRPGALGARSAGGAAPTTAAPTGATASTRTALRAALRVSERLERVPA